MGMKGKEAGKYYPQEAFQGLSSVSICKEGSFARGETRMGKTIGLWEGVGFGRLFKKVYSIRGQGGRNKGKGIRSEDTLEKI